MIEYEKQVLERHAINKKCQTKNVKSYDVIAKVLI